VANEPISLTQFLEGVPPSIWRVVHKFLIRTYPTGSKSIEADLPTLSLECGACDGEMNFDSSTRVVRIGGATDKAVASDEFLRYTCRHCRRSTKTFAVRFVAAPEESSALKLGEWPPFGPRMPRVLLELQAS